jgi:hypothetical protein
MTIDQIRNRISIRWTEEGGRKRASATLVLGCGIDIDPREDLSRGHIQWIEAELKERILGELYEDRRKEIWKAVEAVHMADPYSADLRDRLNHLFGLVKAMQPK